MAVRKQKSKGVALVELLIVIAIITTAFSYLLGLTAFSFKRAAQQEKYLQAVLLAEEILEGVRAFRDSTDWPSDGLGVVANGTVFRPEYAGAWGLVLGGETVNGFERNVVFSQVLRDANDNIVEGFGTPDPNSKKAVVTVSWEGTYQIEIASLFTRWQ